MSTDILLLLSFPRYKDQNVAFTQNLEFLFFKSNFDRVFFHLDSLWNYLFVFSKQIYLALMVSKIKGMKGGQKGPTFKINTFFKFHLYQYDVFSIEYLWKAPIWSALADLLLLSLF